MAEESGEKFPTFDLMSAFGLKRSGSENQNQNKSQSKQTNKNSSAEEEVSYKKRRFAEVESEDLDSSTRELENSEHYG